MKAFQKVDKVCEDIKEKQKELAELRKKGARTIVSILKDVMQEQDVVTQVRWEQYTPYFNDGDVCEFSINDIQATLSPKHRKLFKSYEDVKGTLNKNGRPEVPYVYFDGDNDNQATLGDLHRYIEETSDVLNNDSIKEVGEVLEALNKIDETLHSMEDSLKEEFGDHVQVTVTKKGIEVEAYDHD